MATHYFSSESVTVGHPDKLADQISDRILDTILTDDPHARVAVETLLARGLAVVAGEVTTEAYVNVEQVVRDTISAAGYTDATYGMDGRSFGVLNSITSQSPEIAEGVTHSLEVREGTAVDDYDRQGAGDQGLMFGYANNDNSSFYPAAGKIAHLLADALRLDRATSTDSILLPDGKTQVTLRYEDGLPVEVDTVLISTQHLPGVNLNTVQSYVRDRIIRPVLEDYNENHSNVTLTDRGNYIINPAGEWNLGGSHADSGLTGRKITVDTYAGYARHGGGAFSGKDPSKVDRSAAYYARYVAKNLVAAGAATELELQVSYAIGQAHPTSYYIDTRGKRSAGVVKIEGIINELFDFRPLAIIHELELLHPRYSEAAKNGHFGRNPADLFTWERLDKVDAIRELL